MAKLNIYLLIIKNKLFYILLLQFILGHHPVCDEYESHVWKFGPVRFCKTCTSTVLLFLFSVVLFLIFPDTIEIFKIEWLTVFLLLIFSPVIVIYLSSLKKTQFISRFSRLIFPLYFGYTFYSSFVIEFLLLKMLLWLLLLILFVLSISKRAKKMKTICRECQWHADFANCPGFEIWRELTTEIAVTQLTAQKLRSKRQNSNSRCPIRKSS